MRILSKDPTYFNKFFKHCNLIFLIILSTCLFGQKFEIPYQLDQPTQIVQLSKELKEISGLSFYQPGSLLCQQDEEGIVYVIDIHSGKIKEKYKIAKKGDFEGIEYINNEVWMVTSKGDLYRSPFDPPKKSKTKEYKTKLNRDNNIEGLGFDSKAQTLLLACKDRPSKHKNNYKGFRAIYAFSLKDKKITSKPKYLIDLKTVNKFYQLHALEQLSLDILNRLKGKDDDIVFKPSGIAVHPISHHIYVLSGKIGGLAVLNQEGELIYAKILKSRYFLQPEGICFDLSGNLYISNEGSKSGGTLLTFLYQQ